MGIRSGSDVNPTYCSEGEVQRSWVGLGVQGRGRTESVCAGSRARAQQHSPELGLGARLGSEKAARWEEGAPFSAPGPAPVTAVN